MRKHHQKQILDLIETMREAQSAGFYADCQECAIAVGEFIEGLKGEGTQTVTLLEEYCDLLYEASNGEIGKNKLDKQLVKIENSVKSELKPDKVEFVFLSYKASMGDSLETIFLAAKADPNCDAYWIPIPYFDRNSDGSAGAMHYEGAECYGGNIECIDFKEYDIEARKPDAIFTFNPYDSANYVTSVHPNYYCERLRGLTDMLVYIPYFVAGDGIQEFHCTTAGCLYAHKVILHTEKARDTFIRVFKEAYGNKHGKPEDKFIALGSPKLDKVVNSKREDFELPDEWRNLIDGKKVILYNTSLAAILQDTEQYMLKLRHVLNTFCSRDDVIVWWRPHPLSETTLQSMRPQMLDEYKQIVADYRDSGCGIYDESPDLHRAIAWTDAYYGDASSLLTLYHVTGKPMMLANTEALSDEAYPNPIYLDADSEDLWIVETIGNALYKIDSTQGTVEFVDVFPNEKASASGPLYHQHVMHNGSIYFPPFMAGEIAVYSTDSGTFTKIPYANIVNGKEVEYAFFRAVAYKDRVYFFPHCYPAIIGLDTKTNGITYYSDCIPVCNNRTGDRNFHFYTLLVQENIVWLPSARTNKVVAFDMETCSSVVYTVGAEDYCYCRICFDGENYWLSPNPFVKEKKALLKWNPKKGVLKEFNKIDFGANLDFGLLYHLTCCAGYCWLLPVHGKHTLKIDIITDEISVAHELAYDCSVSAVTPRANNFDTLCDAGEATYVYKYSTGTIVKYDFSLKKRTETQLEYSEDTMKKIRPAVIRQIFADTCMSASAAAAALPERQNLRPGDFVEHVVNDPDERAVFKRQESAATAGQTIYEYAKQQILGL